MNVSDFLFGFLIGSALFCPLWIVAERTAVMWKKLYYMACEEADLKIAAEEKK